MDATSAAAAGCGPTEAAGAQAVVCPSFYWRDCLVFRRFIFFLSFDRALFVRRRLLSL